MIIPLSVASKPGTHLAVEVLALSIDRLVNRVPPHRGCYRLRSLKRLRPWANARKGEPTAELPSDLITALIGRLTQLCHCQVKSLSGLFV